MAADVPGYMKQWARILNLPAGDLHAGRPDRPKVKAAPDDWRPAAVRKAAPSKAQDQG